MARGLAPSREQARAVVAAGRVTVGGAPATKSGRLVAPDEALAVEGPPAPYVSRGGEKLAAALDRFGIEVAGCRALDAGASTGGFTDCLLQRGASQVVAVDVGRGQLHDRLRRDARVVVLERTNVRYLRLAAVGGEPFSLVVADLSFISLRTVAAALGQDLAATGADLVLLVKPQFEAGRLQASRGRGVIRDPADWAGALVGVQTAFRACGAAMMGVMASPLLGPRGNVEFLVHCRARARQATGDLDIGAAVAEGRALVEVRPRADGNG